MITAADVANLRAIAAGNALPAEVENDLEERGLIVQDHRPYAHLTDEGHAAAPPAEIICDICGDRILSSEPFSDDGSEVAHTACVRNWFRRNYGREGLS